MKQIQTKELKDINGGVNILGALHWLANQLLNELPDGSPQTFG